MLLLLIMHLYNNYIDVCLHCIRCTLMQLAMKLVILMFLIRHVHVLNASEWYSHTGKIFM